MIRTKKETPLGFGYRITSREPPRRELTVIVRGRFVLAPGVEPGVFVAGSVRLPEGGDEATARRLHAEFEEAALTLGQLPLRGDVYADDDTYREGALLYPSDLAEFKPRAELIVKGSCHPPGGKATVCKVAVEIGSLRKELAVFGDRRWIDRLLGGKHTEPEPFQRMPLDWSRAFGGPGCADNPVGRGMVGDALPNVENPRDLLVEAGQRPAPVGFGPVNEAWPLRRRKVGKRYDDAWKRTREPFYAEDYDWSHQNAAPADQQLEDHLRGDEGLAFEHMHPQAPRLETRLPGLRPRAFVARALEPREPIHEGANADDRPARRGVARPTPELAYVEVPLVLDTVLADLDAGELFVTWRGLVEVRDGDLGDVPYMLLAHEKLADPPRPADDYLKRLEAFAADPMGIAGSDLEAMMRLEAEIERGDIDARIDGVDDERSDAVSEVVGPLLGDGAEGGEARRELAASIDDMERREPGTKARLKVELKKVLREVSEGGGATMPAMRSDGSLGVGAFLRQVLRGVSAGQKQAPDHDFSGTNALLESELEAARLPGVEPADRRVPDRDEAPPEPGPGVDLSGHDLSGRDLRGVDLTGANLDGANLARADLREATLVDASLIGASLGAADLSGANCRGASFRLAFMTKTRAVAADFRGANLREAQLERADLGDARLDEVEAHALYAHATVLEGASFRRASLGKAFFDAVLAEGADFSGARLDYAMLRESALSYAKFDGAALDHGAFLACRLDHATFVGAHGARASFQQSSLRHLDARYARFDQPQMAEVDAREANFSAARLARGRFYKASLHGANLKAADLRGLDLRQASLTQADFRGCNLHRAMLHEAHGVDADFRGANLHGADLRRNELVMKT